MHTRGEGAVLRLWEESRDVTRKQKLTKIIRVGSNDVRRKWLLVRVTS